MVKQNGLEWKQTEMNILDTVQATLNDLKYEHL